MVALQLENAWLSRYLRPVCCLFDQGMKKNLLVTTRLLYRASSTRNPLIFFQTVFYYCKVVFSKRVWKMNTNAVMIRYHGFQSLHCKDWPKSQYCLNQATILNAGHKVNMVNHPSSTFAPTERLPSPELPPFVSMLPMIPRTQKQITIPSPAQRPAH